MSERKIGGASETDPYQKYTEIRERFEVWLKEHPVEIPEELRRTIESEEAELKDKNITQERWTELVRLHQARVKGAKDPNGSIADKYYYLHVLRGVVGSSPTLIRRLEEVLADCYCGSGKKFAECHQQVS